MQKSHNLKGVVEGKHGSPYPGGIASQGSEPEDSRTPVMKRVVASGREQVALPTSTIVIHFLLSARPSALETNKQCLQIVSDLLDELSPGAQGVAPNTPPRTSMAGRKAQRQVLEMARASMDQGNTAVWYVKERPHPRRRMVGGR